MPVKRRPLVPESPEPEPVPVAPRMSPLATISEAAAYLKTSVWSVRQMEKQRKIKRVPRQGFGKAFVFLYSELDRYLAEEMV